MITKQTFSQYIQESKRQLQNAIANTPVTVIEYEVRKYCSLPLGENVVEHQTVSLKPKQRIVVQWKYENAIVPTLDFVKIAGTDVIDETEEQFVSLSSQKFKKWLERNTTEGINYGHKI